MRALLFAALVMLGPTNARADCTTVNPEAAALVGQGDAVVKTNVDEAIAFYERAFAAASASPQVASKLAAAYEKKEDWPHAALFLAKAFELDPADARLAFRLGRARLRVARLGRGAFTDAMESLKEAVRLDPNWGEAHFELAEVLWHLEDEAGALEHYTKAVALHPSVALHWFVLADSYRRIGHFAEASKVMAEAPRFIAKDDPNSSDVYLLAGQLHARKDEFDAAVTSYEEAKRACGTCAERGRAIVRFELGRAYLGVKPPRVTEAKSELDGFLRAICKGAAAAHYVGECTEAYALYARLP